jgi:hypothetical protein
LVHPPRLTDVLLFQILVHSRLQNFVRISKGSNQKLISLHVFLIEVRQKWFLNGHLWQLYEVVGDPVLFEILWWFVAHERQLLVAYCEHNWQFRWIVRCAIIESHISLFIFAKFKVEQSALAEEGIAGR